MFAKPLWGPIPIKPKLSSGWNGFVLLGGFVLHLKQKNYGGLNILNFKIVFQIFSTLHTYLLAFFKAKPIVYNMQQ